MGFIGAPGPCTPAFQSGFSAALFSSYPPPNHPVAFPMVMFNQGNFNPAMGIYRAPVNGTYVFSYHLTVRERALKVGLFHNFRPIVRTTVTNFPGEASQQVVLHLTQGEQVWLLVRDEENNGMFADSESSSTFSGFLMHSDSCMPPTNMLRDGSLGGLQEEEPEVVYDWGQMPEQ